MKIKVKIQGLSPLLMNRFTAENGGEISDGHRPAAPGGERGTPREQAEKTAYRDDKGNLYYPGPNLFSCLIEAGKYHKVGKNKVTTQKSSLVPAGLSVMEIAMPFGTKDFEVDSRRVVIPSTGGAVVRHRARLDSWTLSFTLDVDEGMFTSKFVRMLVDDAGRKVGLGDYRPARKGPFGRFVVTEWKEEK